MQTNINPSAISTVLILIAAASLITMIGLNQISYIVHGDLYNYGLRFSYRWAMPYWVFSGIIFGLCWTNIALSIIANLYIFRKNRRSATTSESIPQGEEAKAVAQFNEETNQRKMSEYVEQQGEELTVAKEETAKASGEGPVEEEIMAPKETVDTVETQPQTAQQTAETEPEPEPTEETSDVAISTEDSEEHHPLL
jgi:hypothetical protein